MPFLVSTLGVVQLIEDKIALGQLVPGQRLVEPDLMEELGVSRTTVREALNFLAGDGVVELIPFRGGRIRKFDPQRLGDMLDVFWGILRMAIERFCDGEIDAATSAELESAFAQIVRVSGYGTLRDRIEACFALNDVIYRHSGNAYFAEALRRLHVRHYLRQVPVEAFLGTDIDLTGLYRKITDALIDRDATRVLALLDPEMRKLAAYIRTER